jgi:hypothetical protein
MDVSNWPKYESHKTVQAMPITGITPAGVVLVGARHEAFFPTEPSMATRAEVGGYAVVYNDGFKSVSPKKAFEDGYVRIP